MSMELKSYLSRKFEGRESFLENIVFPIFGEERFEDMYDVDALDNEDLQAMAQRTGIKSAILYGLVQIGTTEIYIYDVTVSDRVIMRRNRVGIQQLIRKIMETYTSAFIIFHYEDSESWDWRFSFCQKDDKEVTEAKRYTFLLGPDQSCRTAAENFQKLIDKHGDINRDDIVKAFDVAALSDEFFGKYKAQYEKFCNYIYDNCEDESLFGYEFAEWDEKLIRDYVKKLLGRIVFLHFLQKKGWLGVPLDGEWGDGDKQFMKHLFEASSQKQKDNYLDCVLEPLFANALNTQRTNDIFDLNVEGFRNTRIPYLNGGLFERDMLDEPKSTFPASYFDDLFEFFYQYNFTIDENDPNDAEVGIDPEMLGRIFENLLEDNKDKGAFYTPKEIVQYMCRESLIAYLTTCVMKKQGENHKPEDEIKESVRQLLIKPEDIVPRMKMEHLEDFDSYIRNVKICDPAIGSGAFPMGLLNELVRCRVFINAWAKDEKGNLLEGDYAALKTEIISNNIYGVDIEKGAIDIARLRFWLSIIVDEQTPHVLPNFDYKFMQGNSLIPTFDGKFINLDTTSQSHINVVAMKKEKQHLYELKQKYYKAEGEDKHELNVQIKDTILKLISRQLGYESRAWYLHNAVQTTLDFGEVSAMSFDKVRQSLPAEKLESIELAETLHAKLNDKSIPVSERSQIDIHFFDWRIMFTDVFDNGGFDIVIGNPPYVRVQNLEYNTIDLLKKNYRTALKRIDLSLCFIELSKFLCSDKGICMFITSNQFLTTEYGKAMREFLLKDYHIISCVDLGDLPIFESALTYVSIFQFSNINFGLMQYYHVNSMNCVKSMDYGTPKIIEYEKLSSDNWNLKGSELTSIFQKLIKTSKILGDIGHCNAGLITGCDSVLMFSTKDLPNIKFEKEILLPVLRADNCSKFHATHPEKFVIYPYCTENGKTRLFTELELSQKYPLAYDYLLSHKETLYNRKDSRTTIGEKGQRYGLVRFGRKEMFDKPKIISPGEVLKHKFCIDYTKSGFSCARVFAITVEDENTDIKYVLAIMNSNIIRQYLQSIASLKSGGYYSYSSNILNRCPIANANKEQQIAIIALVDSVMNIKNQDPQADTSAIEHEIDQLVYKLYGLTDEEIAIVEGKNE